MIVFELICPDRHRFEGWFASSADFEGQKAAGLLSCPVCCHSGVEKLLTAKIAKGESPRREPVRERGTDVTNARPAPADAKAEPTRQDIVDFILMNTENVGRDFPAQARRIHYKEVPHKNIRGVATFRETRELLEEGVEVVPLPIPPRSEWN
jgi:hypothetical protein